MSAAANDLSVEKAAEAPGAPGPMTESDHFETALAYEPAAKLPILVVLVWVCAFIGLGAYTVVYLFPDLAAWGK